MAFILVDEEVRHERELGVGTKSDNDRGNDLE
jgi:hypothetical protein